MDRPIGFDADWNLGVTEEADEPHDHNAMLLADAYSWHQQEHSKADELPENEEASTDPESFCSAEDSPYTHLLSLSNLMQSGEFLGSDGRLTTRAVDLIKSAIEACWTDPHDGLIFRGSASWLQDELNAVRPATMPELRFQYFRSHTTSPLKGPDIFHPGILQIQLRNGESFRTTNSTQIDR